MRPSLGMMGMPLRLLAAALALQLLLLSTSDVARGQHTERIEGNSGNVLEDDPVGRLKVFIYEMPRKYNLNLLAKDNRCLHHMFAAEIFMHQFLLSSAVRTLDHEEADWFYTPVYTTCDLTPQVLEIDKQSRTKKIKPTQIGTQDFNVEKPPPMRMGKKPQAPAGTLHYFGSVYKTPERYSRRLTR